MGLIMKVVLFFRVMRKEHYSPKGKAIILNNEFYEKIIYKCNLCKACGDGLCDSFQKARRVLVLKGKEMNTNNPFFPIYFILRLRSRDKSRFNLSIFPITFIIIRSKNLSIPFYVFLYTISCLFY